MTEVKNAKSGNDSKKIPAKSGNIQEKIPAKSGNRCKSAAFCIK